jgi:hypothetical protein
MGVKRWRKKTEDRSAWSNILREAVGRRRRTLVLT